MVYPYDLTVKKTCFNPLKRDIYYLPKKRPDVSFKHAVDLIRAKITPMRCLLFNALQDSSEYRFADDGIS